jgi:hypothetical protein
MDPYLTSTSSASLISCYRGHEFYMLLLLISGKLFLQFSDNEVEKKNGQVETSPFKTNCFDI